MELCVYIYACGMCLPECMLGSQFLYGADQDCPKYVIYLSFVEMTVGVEMGDTFLLNCDLQQLPYS